LKTIKTPKNTPFSDRILVKILIYWHFIKSPVDKITSLEILFVVIFHQIMTCLITIGGLSIIVPIGHCQSIFYTWSFHWAKSIDCWFSNLAIILLVIVRSLYKKIYPWKFFSKTFSNRVLYNWIFDLFGCFIIKLMKIGASADFRREIEYFIIEFLSISMQVIGLLHFTSDLY